MSFAKLDLLFGEFATARIVRFRGTWLRCNSVEWGAPKRRTFLQKALLRPSRLRHSASLRLALHLKNRTLHPAQLPDLGL
jgi:hypothetical protein